MSEQEILERLQALELKVKTLESFLETNVEPKKLEGLLVGPCKYPYTGYGPQNPVASWDVNG